MVGAAESPRAPAPSSLALALRAGALLLAFPRGVGAPLEPAEGGTMAPKGALSVVVLLSSLGAKRRLRRMGPLDCAVAFGVPLHWKGCGEAL